jgi:hypothetical protein
MGGDDLLDDRDVGQGAEVAQVLVFAHRDVGQDAPHDLALAGAEFLDLGAAGGVRVLTLDHLAKRAGLMTLIHKPDPRRGNVAPKPRPMTPEVIQRELSRIQMGDIHLPTTDGRQLVLRRVARPHGEAQTHSGRPRPELTGAVESRPRFVVKTFWLESQKPPCFRYVVHYLFTTNCATWANSRLRRLCIRDAIPSGQGNAAMWRVRRDSVFQGGQSKATVSHFA